MKDFFESAKESMMEVQLKSRGISSGLVLYAMRRVSREKFISRENIRVAYHDGPVSIGYGQTISQPYMVAMMTEALQLSPTDRVLEIGTGSGYQAAVLREITPYVYSIERIPALAQKAGRVLADSGYGDIVLKTGDGSQGWAEKSPFDAILVTSGSPTVPRTLVRQLAECGRLVIPVGPRDHQQIVRITREKDKLKKEEMISCIFVPLIGKYGWHESET